ncbi:MAG: YwdI family protein [Kurthia sp.]|nr:YwdI family protein [Candidatus Kurthia equi]
MISYDMIIAELEKQLNHAKITQSPQGKREALAAIRALCDVALQSETPKQTMPLQGSAVVQPVTPATQSSQVMQQSSTMSPPNQANRLIEEDANGDSLFDF